ncbi:MAG: hypothetical protein LBE06_03210 [Azoarcus sp.]|nr:hypothetical protein [Azoarcus sp.]
MMIVMDIESGEIIRAPMSEAENGALQPPARHPRPQPRLRLQDIRFSPTAACLPPPPDIDAFLAAFDF